MMKTTLFLSATAIAFSAHLSAQTTIVNYTIDDTNGLTAITATDVASTDLTSPDWTLDIALNDFLNIPESAGMEDGQNDDMAAAFTSGQFLEFTISTTAGSFDLYELQMTLERSSNGPQDWGLRISDDGFASGNSDTGLAAFNLTYDQDVPDSAELKTVSLSGLTLDAATDYTFRIAYDDRGSNNAGSSAGRFYDIAVTVPEPGSFALLAGCLALTSVMLRRRRA